jgi:hypothetical protein
MTADTIWWGSSASTPITSLTGLQLSGVFDTPYGQKFDFSSLGSLSAYWNIAVPNTLDPINTVTFNDSPIEMLPNTSALVITATSTDTLGADLQTGTVGQPLAFFATKGSLYPTGATVSMTGGGITMTGTVTSVVNNTVVMNVTAITPSAGGLIPALSPVSISVPKTYNLYYPPAVLTAFNGLSISVAS